MQGQQRDTHEEGAEEGWMRGRFTNVQNIHRQRKGFNTRNRYRALSIQETTKEEDEGEKTIRTNGFGEEGV